jgi:hypothetical protein
MVAPKDFFPDEETPSERPGKNRSFGKNDKDKRRFETQEDFGITRRNKARFDDLDEDEDYFSGFDEDDEEFDEDDIDFDDDDLDFEDDDDGFDDDYEDDEDR